MNKITFSYSLENGKKKHGQSLWFFVFLLMMAWSSNAAIKTAIAGGTTAAPLLWNAPATWGGVLPIAGDDIVIPNGSVVAANLNTPNLASLTIQSGGILQSTTSSFTLSVTSLNVNSGGLFSAFRTAITVNGPTIIGGTIYIDATTSRTDVFAGDVTLNVGSVWTSQPSGAGASARTVDFQGNFINNASTFSVADDNGVHTFSGTGKIIGGTTPTVFNKITITGTREISVGAALSTSPTATRTAGTLTLSGTLTNKGTLNIAGSTSVTTALDATTVGNTVNYNGVAAQTVMVAAYVNLGLSGGAVAKTIATGTTIAGDLSISGSATASVGTGMNILLGGLKLGGVAQTAGTYGATASFATYTNNTYFTSTATGIVTVPLSGFASPILTADTSATTVDNNIDITFTDDATWRGLVTAVKVGGITLTAGTDYSLTAGNLQLKPSGLNALLTTSGSKIVAVVAIGYLDATVTQLIGVGVPTSNSTATISAALAPNITRLITCTAKDQFNNLVSGYAFKYDASITNNSNTTTESYTLDTVSRTTSVADISLVAITDANGVATFNVILPAVIDGNDGISIQTQLNNGTTNVGSAFTYYQLATQTIVFGVLAPVAYGDATINLSATSSTSGINPITYSSSNTAVATVLGNVVTIVGAGSTNITASQAGNNGYNAALDVPQTLLVNQKSLLLATPLAANKVYNGTNVAVISGTLSGVLNSDDVTVNFSGTFADVNVANGIAVTSTCTLSGTKAGNYFLIQPTGLTADITIASQIITFPATATNYQNFTTYTPVATSATSATNPITFTSSNPAVAIIVGGQIQYVGIGVTTITASQSASSNYAATSATQTLTIMPTPIAAWNFWTSSSTSQTTKQAYIFNSGLSTASSADLITRGAGAGASGGTSAFRTTGFPITTATPTNLVTTANTAYFQTTIQATAGKSVSLSTINARFYSAGAGTSPVVVAFESGSGASSQFGYSLDGGTTMVPITALPIVSTSLTMAQLDLSGIAALQNVPSGTTITLRYYASGQSNRGWGFGSPTATSDNDGLVIGGSIACVAPTVYTVTGGGTDCVTSGVAMGLSGSQLGFNYQLAFNGVNIGAPIAGTGAALSIPNQTTDGLYTITASNANCASSATMTGSAVVTLVPVSSVGAVSANQTICSGATLSNDISIASAVGSIQWQSADDAGFTTNLTNIGSNSNTLTVAQVGTLTSTKYFRAIVTSGVCSSVTSGTIIVTVNTTAAPTASAQSFCNSGTVAGLTAVGTGLQWYATATSTTPLSGTTTLATGNYYVSQTANTCEGPRASVAVTVNTTAAPTASAQSFCNSGTVAGLTAVGTGLQWYATATSTTPLSGTTALATGNYYVSQTANTCEGPRALVAVTVNTTAAPTASAQSFCNSGTVAGLTAVGTGLQWYATATSTTPLSGTTALATGNYYVSQTANTCEGPRALVAVTVNTTAAPTGAATQSLSSLLTVGSIVVVGTNVVWYASSANAASGTNPLPNTTLLANTTYYATQTVGGCTSATSLAVTITTLANQDFDRTNFSYYPNPVSDMLTLSYSHDITNVTVYNLIGQQLLSKEVNSTSTQIDMSNYVNGAYFVQISTGNTIKTVRIIKK